MNLAPAALAARSYALDLVARDDPAGGGAAPAVADEEEDGFAEALAALNPLQYLPIVGTIYRAITGERPDTGWRMGGAVVTGMLMGGPIGIVTSLIGVGLEELFHRVADAAGGAGTTDEPGPDPATRSMALAAYQAAGAYGPEGGAGG